MRTVLKTIMTWNDMKRKIIVSILICVFVAFTQAKTTYIPTYDNRLVLIENGEVDSLTNKAHSLIMSSKDGLITCTLAQQVVSQDLVRDIKRAKNAAGWAMVAAALSSASEGMAQGQILRTYQAQDAGTCTLCINVRRLLLFDHEMAIQRV